MSRQASFEQIQTYSDGDSESHTINRRVFLGGAGVAAFSLATRSFLENNNTYATSDQYDDNTMGTLSGRVMDNVAPDRDGNPETGETDIYAEYTNANLRSPDYFRRMVEESSGQLKDAFVMTLDQIATPEELPELFAHYFTEAANIGKTPEEIEAYVGNLPEDADQSTYMIAIYNYLDDMAAKYDDDIIESLFGKDITNYTYYETRAIFQQSRKIFAEDYYLRGIKNGIFKMNIAKVDVDILDTGRYHSDIEIQLADNIGNYDITGLISLSSIPNDEGRLVTSINEQPEHTIPLDQFTQLETNFIRDSQ